MVEFFQIYSKQPKLYLSTKIKEKKKLKTIDQSHSYQQYPKYLKKIIHKRIYKFLQKHKTLYNSQYGFRPEHSTVNAITEYTIQLIENLENKKAYTQHLPRLIKSFRHHRPLHITKQAKTLWNTRQLPNLAHKLPHQQNPIC